MKTGDLIAGLLLLTLVPAGAGAAREKIHPWLLRGAATGTQLEFLVIMKEGADLSPSRRLKSKAERGRFVNGELRRAAARGQGALRAWLKARGVERLVITGMVTHGCVKNTCLGGLAAGYPVILVADGHSSYSQKAGELIAEWNEKLARQGAQVLSAAEVVFG
jgi:hypothetical protein